MDSPKPEILAAVNRMAKILGAEFVARPTPSEETVERVARAIYASDCANDPIEPEEPNWGRGGYKTEVLKYRAAARAAIKALGEE